MPQTAYLISGYIMKRQISKICLKYNPFSAFYPCFWLEVWLKSALKEESEEVRKAAREALKKLKIGPVEKPH